MKAISILPAITITDGKEKLFIKFGDNICVKTYNNTGNYFIFFISIRLSIIIPKYILYYLQFLYFPYHDLP